MSVILGSGGKVLLGPGGEVATDPACCCGATTPTGACCAADESCSITTEADCIAAFGNYQGDNTTCEPNPCAFGPCNCNPDAMLFPFLNPDDFNYYAQRLDNCCTSNSTYALPCSSTTRFAFLTSVNEACGPNYSGGCTISQAIDFDTCGTVDAGCNGTILDDSSHCIEGCDPVISGCDNNCSLGGCQPGTTSQQTLSGGCNSGLSAPP